MELNEQLRAALKEATAEAARLHKGAKDLQEAMVAEGADPMQEDNFNKLDEAYKLGDAKSQEAAEIRAKLERVEGWGASVPPMPLERPAPLSIGENAQRLRIGARFVQSEQYQTLHRLGIFRSDTGGVAALANGLPGGPVEIVSRDELQAALEAIGYAQYMATTVTGGGATSAGPFIQNDLIPGFISYRRKRPLLAAMVGQGMTDSDVVEYVSQSAPTDAAAETAEDTAAPESTYAFATNTTNVREITHFVPVTLRAMADHGQIRTIIENELAMGALDILDTQIASGPGTGVTLTGIYNASGIGTQALGGDSRPDAIHKAITQIRVAAGVLGEPDAVGIHPNDAQDLILETDANGQYLMGPPASRDARTIWGIPLVVSTVFTSGTVLVGDFAGSATLWLREALSVTTGLDGNDFTKRRVSILAALRVAFAVTRAGGFATVTGF